MPANSNTDAGTAPASLTSDGVCLGPAENNPCHACRTACRCYYRPRPDDGKCSICYSGLYGVEARCSGGRCKTLVCLPCSINELKGLCPICDREETNETHHCPYCHENVRVGKYMVYDCDDCGKEHETCETCFETWKVVCDDGGELESDEEEDR